MNTSTPAHSPYYEFPRPAASLSYTNDLIVTRALAQPIAQPPRGMPNTGIVWAQEYLPLFFALFLLPAVIGLASAWYTNDFDGWTPFWICGGVDFLINALFLVGSWVVWRREQHQFAHPVAPPTTSLAALRAAVLAGDDKIVPPLSGPVAATGKTASSATENYAAPEVLSLVPPERRLLRTRRVLLWALWPPAFLFQFVIALTVSRGVSAGQFAFSPMGFLMWLYPGAMLYLYFGTIHIARPRTLKMADDRLRWRRFTLPWSEMCGLCVLMLDRKGRRGDSRPGALYSIFGRHASLTWYVDPSNETSASSSARLVQRVQSQTGLPLRDLTPGFIRVNDAVRHSSTYTRNKLLGINTRTFGGTASMPSLRMSALLFCLATLVLLSRVGMPYAQQRYFGGQLKSFESSATALRDPLTSDNLGWTPLPPSVAKGLTFTPNGYLMTISNACCDAASLIPQAMRNGLLEVTFRTNQQTVGYNVAGIVFRADRAKQIALVFSVWTDGSWELSRMHIGIDGTIAVLDSLRLDTTMFGSTRGIVRGPNATNRLAVLMQGSSFTFFANGQFLAGYQAKDVPAVGQIGVYADAYQNPVTFSDLLIAPA